MAKVKTPAGPDFLSMDLFAPGMTALHRAGLGGLACTLRAIEREYAKERITDSKLPAPFAEDSPPWEISEREVVLKFGRPERAAKYLERLFVFAFGLLKKEGLIYLPGQFRQKPLDAVLADLQLGLTLTFLQHGRVRQLAKEPSTITYDTTGSGLSELTVEYKKCSGFKHQNGWQEFVDKQGCLTTQPVRVEGPVSPGAVVRHVAFTGPTSVEDLPSRVLPLYFALVGCLPLAVNRGVAALLIPEVENLLDFTFDRPLMSPSTPGACLVTNAADGALQMQLRVRLGHLTHGAAIPGCYAMTFMPTAWASQQKSRVATLYAPGGDQRTLDRFERAMQHLPPRIATRTIKETSGRGKQKKVTERSEAFRVDSVVRPLIAENLATNRRWYAGFQRLITATNPATGRPFRQQLSYERKGLHAMISDDTMWDDEGERLIVQAVHEAIRQSLGRIRDETDGKEAKTLSPATKNRWERFREKLRLDLAGAKTAAHVRFALTDLFSRGGSNSVLRSGWVQVLPVLRRDWQLARDLGLLALASYAGRGGAEAESTTDDN
ncbi:MAG: type I-MYXAN CRISPR-associated Cas8a1/Cmx1 [Planctomycetaceae bacterium]